MDRKDTYTQVFLKTGGESYDEAAIKKFRSIWWQNNREKNSGGLRITESCLNFIENQAKIKTYKIDFPKDLTIGPQVLIWLDQFIESPFYLEKKFIKVLTEKAAFELYLFSGDVRKMGSSKALAKRLNQELASQ